MNIRQFCPIFFETDLFNHLTAITLIACISCFASNSVQAGIVDLTVFGETTGASNQNAFGLSAGDQVSIKATFDYSVLSGTGIESISFGQGTGNTLSLLMGDLTFNSNSPVGFGLSFPMISFFDGIFTGIDYFSFSSLNGTPAVLFSHEHEWFNFYADKTGAPQGVNGDWDPSTQKIASADIPEPGPLALAGLGLLGAWVASRRRKTLI